MFHDTRMPFFFKITTGGGNNVTCCHFTHNSSRYDTQYPKFLI